MLSRITAFVVAVLLLTGSLVMAQQDRTCHENEFDCFTILVGKNASDNGAVYFAHNEDDYGKQLVNWFVQEERFYHEGEEVVLKNGGRLNQVERTNRFLWLEMPGMDFADSYMNQHGVTIGSNSCPSREDQPEITDGGIGYRLRGLMAERSVSARDAVRIAGELIERFGYTGSGRTYSIADPNEAWALSVVRGKHWVAQRIPDDAVMVLPNYYTMTSVNLLDKDNFMGSADLIDYAVKRGWYDPERDGEFNFRKAYADPGSLKHPGNINRAWGAYHLLKTGFTIDQEFPFTIIPYKKLGKKDLMDILAFHYENTPLDKSEGYTKGSPYELNGSMICGKATVYGFVAELRNWMPVDVGCLWWLAPQWPDIQPFIPWYAGMTSMPDEFARPGYFNSFADHYSPPEDIHVRDDHHAFWAFVNFSDLMNQHYGQMIPKVRRSKQQIESVLLGKQERVEAKAMKLYQEDPEKGNEFLTRMTHKLAKQTLKKTRKYLN